MTKKRTTIYFTVVGEDKSFLDRNDKVTQKGIELMRVGLDLSFLIILCRDRGEVEQIRNNPIYRNHETKIVGIESILRITKSLKK